MVVPAVLSAEDAHLSIPNNECLPPLKTSTSIRLIDLEPGKQDSDIIISINTYDLPDLPQYAAFSYTWGDPLVHPYVAERPSRTIWIGIKPFLVTRNLYDALNHWRGWKLEIGTAKTLLWVDAICINQDDLIERNHQVGLMGHIYSKATIVLTWVGTPDEDAWTAIKLIYRLKPIVELWQSEGKKTVYSHDSDDLFETTGVSKVTPKEWEALISFYLRQYFSRAWIVQEIALAKGALLILGHYHIHWNDLIGLSVMMRFCRWIPLLEQYTRPRTNADGPQLTLGAPAVYKNIRELCQGYGLGEHPELQESTALLDTRTFYLLLEQLLYETRYFRATNPRDKIYAVLSIVKSAFGAMDSTIDLLRPDYRLSVRKVFIDVTREIATKTGSVSVLSQIDHDSKGISDLPSWVPDYSAYNPSTQALAYVCGARLYRAFSQIRRSPEPTIVNDVLFLCAMRWDTIADIELTERPFPLQGNFDLCLQLPDIYFNGQTRIEALWRTLIADTDGHRSPAPEGIGNSFRQLVLLAVATRVREIIVDWDQRQREVLDFVSMFKLNSKYDEPSDPWLPRGEEVESFWNTFQTMGPSGQEKLVGELREGAKLYAAAKGCMGSGRALFKSVGNLLGLTPVSAKRGDTTRSLPSSKVPFVLRHCGGKQYKLIGEAYLHGYMHGEIEKYSMPLQFISLV